MEINNYANKSILLSINSSYETVIRNLNYELKEYGCNYIQSLILISIFFEKEKYITPSKTAKVLKTSKSNISHALSSLEKSKYIKRNLSKNDSRSYTIELSSKGEKIVSKLMQKIDEYENLFVEITGKKKSDEIAISINNYTNQFN